MPKDAIEPTRFVYIDPEEFSDQDSIEDVDVFNEIRVGTLSGEPPGKDIYIELLDYAGGDIHGNLYVEGELIPIGGGPGALAIVEEVPPDVFGGLGVFSCDALATNDLGQTFGLSNDGILIQIDALTGEVERVVGEIIDTTTELPKDPVTYESLEGAAFDPATGVLYAAAVGPISFDEEGNILATGTILITIDTGSGEANPAGSDIDGNPSYAESVIAAVDLRTIVYDQADLSSALLPDVIDSDSLTFIGYDANPEGGSFIGITLVESGDGMVVTTNILATASADDVVEGLMFDNDDRLFALYHEAATEEDGVLMLVDLFGTLFTEIVTYVSDQDPAGLQIYLTGMSFDVRGVGTGYATDPVSNTLYSINVGAVIEEDGDITITGAANDIYTMYIASSTPDIYITLTQFSVDGTYYPTGGEGAILFDNTNTPEGTGGAMIGTRLEEENWAATTFDNGEERSDGYLPQKGVWQGGHLRPGIQMPGNDTLNPLDSSGGFQKNSIGMIQVGGGVFGDVTIEGSIETFYAGFLGTNRFDVDGDLGNIIVGTQAGGTFDGDTWHPAAGGPILNVTGCLGGFYSNQEWGTQIRVRGYDDVPQTRGMLAVDIVGGQTEQRRYVRVQREMEYKVLPDGQPNNPIEFMDGALDEIITNDDFDTAQFIGTFRSDDKINLVGSLEATGDSADYYSFGLTAGQEITIKLYNTGGNVGISGNVILPDSEVPAPYAGLLSLYDPDQTLAAVLMEQFTRQRVLN